MGAKDIGSFVLTKARPTQDSVICPVIPKEVLPSNGITGLPCAPYSLAANTARTHIVTWADRSEPMFRFDNTYARDLPGSFLRIDPDVAPAPRLLHLNAGLAADLGLDLAPGQAASWFSGAEVPTGAEPIAQAYAGHQFGGFSPKLGDGRAHLLGEILGPDGRRWDIALKGSGRTPFSRGGDGKAAVGPMLREYLISEAMHAMGTNVRL